MRRKQAVKPLETALVASADATEQDALVKALDRWPMTALRPNG